MVHLKQAREVEMTGMLKGWMSKAKEPEFTLKKFLLLCIFVSQKVRESWRRPGLRGTWLSFLCNNQLYYRYWNSKCIRLLRNFIIKHLYFSFSWIIFYFSTLMLLSAAHFLPVISHKLSVLNYSVKWKSRNFTPASSGWFSILCENAKEWPVSLYLWQEPCSCCSMVCRVCIWGIIFIWSSTSQYPRQ